MSTAEIKVLQFAEGTPVDPPTVNPPVNIINQKIRTVEQIDSTTTGASATSVANTSSIMKFTNAGLISLAEIIGADTNQLLIAINGTGVDGEIINGSGILTGTGDNLPWANGSAVFMAFIESLDDWLIIGGSGGGSATQKAYALTNNQALTDVVGLVYDSADETSVFFSLEVERIGTVTYRQTIEAKAVYDGAAWSLVMGGYIGSDLVQSSIVNTQDVVLSITSAGQIRYATGNQAGHIKSTLKVVATRINA